MDDRSCTGRPEDADLVGVVEPREADIDVDAEVKVDVEGMEGEDVRSKGDVSNAATGGCDGCDGNGG